jgi:predicted dehydrogenase
MTPITAAVLGAGDRGHKYGYYALAFPDDIQIVAAADPRPDYLTDFAQAHRIPDNRRFDSWRALLHQPKLADAVLVTLPDRLHFEAASAALRAGYDVLLEKPMSPVLSENVSLVELAREEGRLLQICHVLRYSSFFQAVRRVVNSGQLGRVVHVEHSENVVWWHMAHSFVRGNWRNAEKSGPMILTKCCHDLDILYWILREKITHVASFGDLTHFTPENRPDGAPDRCTDGCPVAENCKYDAVRFYVNQETTWPYSVVSLTPEDRVDALQSGPYGRCVYACDNDVVDHQVVLMETERGTTIKLTMQGHADHEHRALRYEGTRATLIGRFGHDGSELSLHDHLSGNITKIPVTPEFPDVPHGGGDFGLMRSFVNAMNGVPDDSLTTAEESLESHLLAFAAEKARMTKSTVIMESFKTRA